MRCTKPTPDAPQGYALYALTRRGAELALKLIGPLQATLYAGTSASVALSALSCQAEFKAFGSLPDLLTETFSRHSCHIFFCATGIVVRCIAPLLTDKSCDPAVLVIDQTGRFVISLLSGHLGQANDHCRRVAAMLDATAVITTATDVEDLPAIDSLAKERGLRLGNIEAVKAVSTALLHAENVYVNDPDDLLGLRDGPWSRLFHFVDALELRITENEQPEQHTAFPPLPDELPACVLVTPNKPPVSPRFLRRCLYLHPAVICAGIGCKRGTTTGKIISALHEALDLAGLSVASLLYLASLDIKTDEPGLLEAATRLNVPLLFFSKRELQSFPGPSFSPVAQARFGLDGVCEPAALAAACWRKGRGSLAQPKIVRNGVTVALALRMNG